jgi:hypothetical protein
MVHIPEEAVEDVGWHDGHVDVDEDAVLGALIEDWDKRGTTKFSDALRHIRRAQAIRTTDLVGSQRMIGARVTYIDQDGEPHRGIVLEPEVDGIGGQAYDPQKGELVDPSEYPLGTVQLVRGDGWEFGSEDGFFDRVQSDSPGRGLKAETSVTPAASEDDTHVYFAGWGYYDEHSE